MVVMNGAKARSVRRGPRRAHGVRNDPRMILDVRTSYVMGAGFVAIAGAHLLLLTYRLPTEVQSSARAWAAASVLFAVSWSLFAFGDALPDVATVLFGNVAYLWAVTVLYNSLRQFDGLTPRRFLYPLVVLPVSLATLAARYVIDSYDLRVIIMSAAVAALLGLSVHHVLRHRSLPSTNEFGRRALAFWLFVTMSILALRVVVTVVRGAAPPALANGAPQTLALGGALVSVVGLIFSYLLLYVERTTTELRRHADRDPLTGAYNRRALEIHAERQIGLARTWRRPLAVLLMDGDRFKNINDEWGHEAGDQALRTIANALRANLRTQDVLARIGGDEFVVLLPDLDEEGTLSLTRRLSEAVASSSFPYATQLSLSFGVSVFGRDGRDLGSLLTRADEALYEQKRTRRTTDEHPV